MIASPVLNVLLIVLQYFYLLFIIMKKPGGVNTLRADFGVCHIIKRN